MKRGIFNFRAFLSLRELLKRIAPDVVQTWMYHADLFGGIAAKLAGCKKIIWGIHNYNISSFAIGKSTRIIVKICSVFSYLIPKKIISCSEKAIVIHKAIGYKTNKFLNIPLGYDLDEFMHNDTFRIDFRNKYGIKKDDVLIGCVARWDTQKDHANLLSALEILMNKGLLLYCVLVENEMEYKNDQLRVLLDRTVGDTNKIICIGPRNDVPFVMNALDIHVLSSLGEAFPNVVAEAMACTIPCVVTDVGDAAIIVANTGWIVPPGNPTALADAILEAVDAMKDTTAWQQRKQACRQRITDNYTVKMMVDRYRQAWSS
jgi:glycosyltransferase involved in cell wall biosynthesis